MSVELENTTTNPTEATNVENTVENTTEVASAVSNEAYQEAVMSSPVEVKDEQATTIEENSNHTEILAKLAQHKSTNSPIEVVITERTRGGFRGNFEGFNLFLPISQYSSIKNLPDTELDAVIGNKLTVKVLDMPSEESISKSVIVSRTALVEDEVWNKLTVGDRVSGVVSSIPTFGVFMDLGGVEGLVHISKLSNKHVKDTKSFAKVGDKLEAVIIELDRAKNKIALSMKELEANPWADFGTKFNVGTTVKGKVKRIVDFGAFVEIADGVDGILRTKDLSWTKRVRDINEHLKIGDEVEVAITSVNPDKRAVSLSVKDLTPNPWLGYTEKFNKENEFSGVVLEVNEKGCVVNVENEVDAFMPLSRMRPVLVENKVPYTVGENVKVKVVDLVTEQASMIISPVLTAEQEAFAAENQNKRNNDKGERKERREDRPFRPREERSTPIDKSIAAGGGMSFADLLSNAALDKLKK